MTEALASAVWLQGRRALHRASHRDLGHLESDSAGVAHDECCDLDQLELEAGEGPVGHGLGQFNAAQEGARLKRRKGWRIIWLA